MPMPKPLTIPFARDALSQFINEIPDTPQAGADPQLASWSEGFGPITMQPLTSGGKPPEGPDFNGILSALSEHIVYQNGGGIYTFSQEYVDKTGGYDKDSVLIGDDGSALWVSLSGDNAENFNTANPVTKWIKISSAGVEQQIQDILTMIGTKADKTIQVIAGTGLSGGGNLQANRTLSVSYGTTEGTAAQGNDERIVNSVQTSGDQAIGGIKTFSSFPVTPSAAPTDEYQAVNKKYVDDSLDFTIIYPNGGSAENPATITKNMRYVELNPFPGFHVQCRAEIQINGVWADPSIQQSSANTAEGTRASQYNDEIVVRTLLSGVSGGPQLSGSPFPANETTASAPCRVLVWKVKGDIA